MSNKGRLRQLTLYQTLKDKGNNTYILDNGPFLCNWENTWLGSGYYFWDTLVQNAHWWGKIRYGNKYIISSAQCDFNTELCFDLYGDMEHLSAFTEVRDFLLEKEEYTIETLTVARVINYLISLDMFHYEAVRAYGVHSKRGKPEKVLFETGKRQFLNTSPAVQLCLYKKTSLNLREYTIYDQVDNT